MALLTGNWTRIPRILLIGKRSFSSKGVPKDIAAHIEQLKVIAAETNRRHLLPEKDTLRKPKKSKSSSSRSSTSDRTRFHDQYSFNYTPSKSEIYKIKQKKKLNKILNSIQSESMPISQGRIIDIDSNDISNQSINGMNIDPMEKINESTSRLPPNLQEVLSKFTENSKSTDSVHSSTAYNPPFHSSRTSIPSIPIPSIKLDEEFQSKTKTKSDFNSDSVSESTTNQKEVVHDEKAEDEELEQKALALSVQRHNEGVDALKRDLSKMDAAERAALDLREQIESKRREQMNAQRMHFYIKNGKAAFSDIGVSDVLSHRLKQLGYHCPSTIQALFIKQYHALEDRRRPLIMGGETGSGKTLAFMIPIIDEIVEEYLSMNIITLNAEGTGIEREVDMLRDPEDKTVTDDSNQSKDEKSDKMPFLKYPKCIVIEPSAELCRQIRGVIQSIARPFGVRVECWSEEQVPPPMPFLYDYLYAHYDDDKEGDKANQTQSAPEILVATPSVLKHVFDTRLVLRLDHLVVDEADIMLTHKGGHGNWSHIEQILKSLQKFQKDKLLSGNKSDLYQFRPCCYILTGATLANKRVQVFLGKQGARSKGQKKTHLPDSLMKLFRKSVWVTSPLHHRHSPNLTQKWLFVRDNLEQQELLLRALHRHPAQKTRYKRNRQSFPVK